MSKRLLTIADLISGHKGIIDVGTDHGYLPVYLAQNGYKGAILASDINVSPLEKGVRNAEKAGLQDKISFFLSDGLDGCPADAVDTIVIAGMGGDTICGILDRAEWCMDSAYQLILQPVTKAEILRYWLANNGFDFECERIIEEQGFVYQIMSVRFGHNSKLSDAELFIGKRELIRNEELFDKQLSILIKRFEKTVNGLLKAESVDEKCRRSIFAEVLEQLVDVRDSPDDKQ